MNRKNDIMVNLQAIIIRTQRMNGLLRELQCYGPSVNCMCR